MSELKLAHHANCTYRLRGHSDEAKRVSDVVNLHWIANMWECIGKWVAFRLSDGKNDMALYDSKADAVRHQHDPKKRLYIRLVPGGMSLCEAEIVLRTARQMASKGWELDTGPELIRRVAPEHQQRILRQLKLNIN